MINNDYYGLLNTQCDTCNMCKLQSTKCTFYNIKNKKITKCDIKGNHKKTT